MLWAWAGPESILRDMPPGPPRAPRPARRALARRALTVVAAAAAAGGGGCRSLVDPPLPAGAVRFAPPPVYARWWALVEACAGVRGDPGAVAWHVVPGVSSISTVAGVTFFGLWSALRKSSRGSASVAIPTWPACTLPGSGEAGAPRGARGRANLGSVAAAGKRLL